MRKILTLFSLILVLFSCEQNQPVESRSSVDGRVDSLLRLMTLEEKLGQLNLPSAGDVTTGLAKSTGVVAKIREGKVGGLFNVRSAEKISELQRIAVKESRLGIPLLFGMDVIHGYKTTFPIPLAMSCSWDMDLIKRSAQLAAAEASSDGIAWTFSPMTDICRDPRWGRIAEGSGEDPYLGGEVARVMVEGYQGDDLSLEHTMLACVKHFALYGAAEGGRDYNTTDMSRIRMYNEYFPPYKAAIDAGVGTVMASFNEIDGLPATGNRWLLTEVLRDQWGFDGFVVSDYTGVTEMVDHGVGDTAQVAALAIRAGTDMDMVSEAMPIRLEEAVKMGSLNEALIDQACRRILKAKFELGLFDDPYKYCNTARRDKIMFSREHRSIARETATQTFVLLKNEGSILPLQKQGKIAVIGPLADNKENMLGTWSVSGDPKKGVSILDGIKGLLGDQATVSYAKGSNVYADAALEARVSTFGKSTHRDSRSEEALREEALKIARSSDVILAVLGESSEMSGESSSRTNIEIPQTQKRLLKALLATGKPVALVLLTGRPLALSWEEENVPAILNVWFGGTETGNAVADVIFGDVNPSGKLTTSFPRNLGQVPIYYNYKQTGRPLNDNGWFEKFKSNYLEVPNEPLYPFGFGLSYTTFKYGDLKLNQTDLTGDETLAASVEVTNTGSVSGKEIVQLYIRDIVGSVTRPVKELKGFQKIELQPGESKTVRFEITTESLSFYNYDLKYDWEPGAFDIMLGSSSADVQSQRINWNK